MMKLMTASLRWVGGGGGGSPKQETTLSVEETFFFKKNTLFIKGFEGAFSHAVKVPLKASAYLLQRAILACYI